MNDIVILHLSDLHIDATANTYSRLLKGLIKDIKNEIEFVPDKSMVITVTGDVIHQGQKKAISNAIKFFEDLYKVVKEKVIAIYIVPGNHDKFRTEENKFLIPAYRTVGMDKNSKFDKNFYESFWKYQAETYENEKGSGYLEFTKKVYEIFGVSDIDSHKYITDTFGVDVIDVYGRKYCFVMLNTAWSCIDETDTRQLILGKFQIDKIKEEYHNLVDRLEEPIELTLVLGHHPIGALAGQEEDSIFTEMISFEELNANAYLCGHTHDRTVINWVNNRHSINTFMTGIGWPENNSGYHVSSHTYSMYVFNIEANSIDIYVRSTDDGGEFNPDFRIYTNTVDKSNKKIVFPIKAQKAQTYISLGAGPNRSSKAYYISDEFMEYINEYVLRIGRLRQSIGMMIEGDKNELYENIPSSDDWHDDEDEEIKLEENWYSKDEIVYNYFFADIKSDKEDENIEAIISDIFMKCSDIRYNMFLGFLQRLCQKMEKILLYDKLEENDIVRFHFRYLADRHTFLYLKLCTSFPDQIDPSEHEPSEIKFGELIEAAYKTGKSLIYSVNKSFCKKKLKDKWTNFLTVIPLFEENNFKRKYADSLSKNYPFITFGVTINSEKFNKLLYCMDYFSINKMLEEVISTYIRIFRIDMDKFCAWARKELEKEDSNE